MADKPLYQDTQIKIDHLPNSADDHILYIDHNGEDLEYIIPRGVLHELARLPRGGIEEKIAVWNPNILFMLEQKRIPVDGLHISICQAYMEEERRYQEFRLTEQEYE